MDKFIEFLANIPPYIVVVYIAVFLTLEHFWPHSKNRTNRIGHLLHNSGLLVLATVINFFMSFVLVGWIQYIDQNEIGFMNILDFSPTVKAFTGVVVLDFTSYFIHRFIHKSKLLWRFHRVHHSEIEMDSSTSFKFHPLEAVLVFPALLIEIALVGISFPAVVLYNAIILPTFFVLHSNLNYPRWLERTLSPIFATPAFHRVHHSDEQKYTDSNYGDIFSLWDRIFGTFEKADPETLRYGLKEYTDKKSQSLWYMITNPFRH